MCLAYPGKIVSIEGDSGEIDFGGFTKKVNLMLLPDAKVGDFVLVHAGFAIGTTTEGDAIETLSALKDVQSTFDEGHS
ncbi:MAG TPA: HypC/HybG/HupF family hydrogenase formation chaperone [candidate division Zixibacteria bacterium]|nr:HypC/HybG/HupF family hydrogenase formation chaperone [candidate division Zixibacteria bacterium]